MSENFSIDLNKKTFATANPIISDITKSANEETFFIQIRDCFNAGYQMPQYCIDNDIKNPLFVGVDESHIAFLWEIHVQLKTDKRVHSSVVPRFALFNDKPQLLRFSPAMSLIDAIKIEKFSELNLDSFDRIIVLGDPKVAQGVSNVVSLLYFAYFFSKQMWFITPLLNFIEKNPKVKLITMASVALRESEKNTEREKNLLAKRQAASSFRNRIIAASAKGQTVATPYDFLGYTNEEVAKLLKADSITNPDGSTSMVDDEFLHIHNGRRETLFQPNEYKNTIYFFGDCNYYGFGVPYDKTVETYLQKMLNEHNLPYRVENYSQVSGGRYQDVYYNLDKLNPKPNDIIFVWIPSGGVRNIPFFELLHVLDRPHNYGEYFADPGHINELGHKALADKYFEYLTKNDFFQHTNFEYPPPTYTTSLWYSKRKYHRRDKIFAKSAA